MMAKMNGHKANRGFSLVEILVVVAIATSLVLIVSNLSGNVSGLNTLINQELQSKSDTAETLQIMTTEIRSAGTSANGAYPVDAATTSSFAFYSDIHKNGVIDHVRYFLASSTIYKGVIAPSGTPASYPASSEIVTDIIDDVSVSTNTPLFSYYGTSYTGSETPLTMPVNTSDIRLIGITFTATTNSVGSSTPQYFSTLIDIRNLRSN